MELYIAAKTSLIRLVLILRVLCLIVVVVGVVLTLELSVFSRNVFDNAKITPPY